MDVKLKKFSLLEPNVKIKAITKRSDIMNIDAIRGDTLTIYFEIESDQVLALSDDNFKITFSLKQSATASGYVFQKDKTAVTELGENKFKIRIAPEDTTNLVPGFYFYDIQLDIYDDVFTIALGKLHLEIDITRPPAALPNFPYPDIDGDGRVTSMDASLVFAAYNNIMTDQPSGLTPEQENLADCNRDGLIDIIDASLLMSYYSGCGTGKYTNNQEGWTAFMTEHYIPQG